MPAPALRVLTDPWLPLAVLFAATLMVCILLGMPVHKLVLLAALAPIFVFGSAKDITFFSIPDLVSIATFTLGLTWKLYTDGADMWQDLLGAACVFGLLWAVSELYFRLRGRDGLGMGDVKFIGAATMILGPILIWIAVFVAAAGGLVYSGLLFFRHGRPLDTSVPFFPFLSYSIYLTVAAFL